MSTKLAPRHRSRVALITQREAIGGRSAVDSPDPESEPQRGNEVGYRKPPKRTQFKPGRSGNPKGRPKRPTGLEDQVERELAQKITVREGGKSQKLSKREVVAKQLVKKAMEGDVRALRAIMTMPSADTKSSLEPADGGQGRADQPLTENERAVLDAWEAQIREKIAQEQACAADPDVSTNPKDKEDA